MLELDLSGRPATLSDSDARWIYGQAKAASGRSFGARDLVTRLQGLDFERERKKLVLTRAEASALARLLDAADEPPLGCEELRANLAGLLATSRPDPDPGTHDREPDQRHKGDDRT